MFLRTNMRIHQVLIVACIAAVLSGCSGQTVSNGLEKFDDVTEWFEGADAETGTPLALELGAAAPIIIGGTSGEPDNGSAEQNANPFVDSVLTNSEALGAIPDSETSQLTADADFLFPTARNVKLMVNLPSAAGTQASLSLCTDFEENESGYIVNYDSCPIRGVVTDGQFESDMALANQFDSAIAVIWFPHQESGPLYRKFQMADTPDGSGFNEWLWN